MLSRATVAAALLCCGTAQAAALAELEQAMTCAHVFKPQKLLRDLQREGFIATTRHARVDGIAVFAVTRPFRIHGFPVKFVEGWDYDGGLFTFGSGTAPGTFIAVTVDGERSDVERRFHAPRFSDDDGPARWLWDLHVSDRIDRPLWAPRPPALGALQPHRPRTFLTGAPRRSASAMQRDAAPGNYFRAMTRRTIGQASFLIGEHDQKVECVFPCAEFFSCRRLTVTVEMVG